MGDGNPKLIGFSSNKEVKATLQSALFDNRAMALLTGNAIKNGVQTVYRRDVLTVATAKATLTATPKNGIEALYVMGADGVEDTELTVDATVATGKYTLTAKEIGVFTDVTDGSKLVAYYMVDTADTAQTITVSSDAFPAAFKLVLEVLVTDFYTKQLYPAQIIIPSAKCEDGWSLSFAPDGKGIAA